MKTNQIIPLILILVLAGSVAYYVMDFRPKVDIHIDERNLDIQREVKSALRDALGDLSDAKSEVHDALTDVHREIDDAMEEIDGTFDDSNEELDVIMEDLDAELRGIHRDLDDILDEVKSEIEKSDHIRIEREMTREEMEIVKKRVKSIVKRIIAEAIDDEPQIEDKP